MAEIVETENLVKRYGENEVLRGITFSVDEGSLFAFLGPNGAGKSTTISILTTQITMDGGKCTVAGHRLGEQDEAIRRSIGIVFQENVLDRRLSVRENLRSRAGLYGMGRADADTAASRAIDAVDCNGFADQRYGRLSGGQKRKADIARALVHTPKLLFLDEPTTGLDPAARKNVWSVIRRLQHDQGVTIFLTTHYMEEAAQADYVVMIDHGIVAAHGTPAELREEYTRDTLRMTAHNRAQMEKTLENAGIEYRMAADQFEIRLNKTTDAMPILHIAGDNVASLEVTKGSMNQAFLNLTSKEEQEWAL